MHNSEYPDSLDEETPRATGTIKVANADLLSQLCMSRSPSLTKSSSYNRIESHYEDTLKVDSTDYQYVNPNIDEELLGENMQGLESIDSEQLVHVPTSYKLISSEPRSRMTQQPENKVTIVRESTKNFVPPLKLTDSLIADDPEPDDKKVLRDSLDSSLNDEDYQRLEELMQTTAPPSNPFKVEQQTPNTMQELDISKQIAFSTTPKIQLNSQSQMSGSHTSVMSNLPYSNNPVVPLKPIPNTYSGVNGDYSNHAQMAASNGTFTSPEYSGRKYDAPIEHDRNYDNMQQGQTDNSFRNVKTMNTKSDGAKMLASGRTTTAVVGTVAPKPPRPERNFIERNKDKARGVNSAKSSYTSRMLNAKKQQQLMKEWAPGMVVKRKKAASADNVSRINREDEEPRMSDREMRAAVSTNELQSSVRSMWDERATQLSTVTSGASVRKNPMDKPTVATRNVNSGQKIRVDYNLSVPIESNEDIPKQSGMNLIGPVPQHSRLTTQVLTRDQGPVPVGGVYNMPYQTSSGPIPRSHAPSGPVPPFPPTYYGYHSPRNAQFQYQEDVSHQFPIDDRRQQQLYSEVLNNTGNSYRTLHLMNQQQTALAYHPAMNLPYEYESESRWNQKKFIAPHPQDITLEEVRRLEETSGYERPPSLSDSSDLNPYQAVPPIKAETSSDGQKEVQGYAHIHKTNKDKSDKEYSYKVYTLKDYKKLNKEVKLGGLGPSKDPTELKEKHELRQKQLQYAKEAREFDAKKSATKQNRATAKPENKPTQPSGRQLAREYSKTVPKPKQKHNVQPTSESSSAIQSARSMVSLSEANEVPQQQRVKGDFYKTSSNSSPNLLNYAPILESDRGFDYMETISVLHKRHLEEKQLLATLRQKI